MKKLNKKCAVMLGMALATGILGIAPAQEPTGAPDTANTGLESLGGVTPPPAPEFKAVDADNRPVILNKQGVITLLLGTSEDSQNAARLAGKAVHPFQGRADFRLVVLVDLRDSLATWVPSVTLDQMRSNLDREAVELKPFYLKNGNKTDPRKSSEVIADFSGAISSQLGWTSSSENLRSILFGADGREIKRWSKVENMDELQADVKAALDALGLAKHGRHVNASSDGTSDPSTSEGQSQPPVALPVDPDKLPPPGSGQN